MTDAIGIAYTDNEIRQQAIRLGSQAVTADVYVDHALVYFEDGLAATIESDFEEDGYGTLNLINDRLREDHLPARCWRYRWLGGERVDWVAIENESARVYAESALWDEDLNQLVAAVFAGDKQITKAIMATLMTNSDKIKGWITQGYTRACNLSSAKRRYVQISRSLADAHASGMAMAVLHPLAGSPGETDREHFYVVATPGEDLTKKFRERLDMAVALAILPAWADYLFTAGREAGLVTELCGQGPTFAGVRVKKTPYGESGWEAVISAGLRSGAIGL